MAVGSILSNALSGIQTSQTALNTTAANIANANTPGYKRRVVLQETVQIGTTSGGVGIAEIRQIAAKFLVREALTTASSTARYDAESRVHDSLQSFFGSPDQNSSLSGRIDSLFVAISDLASDPSSLIRRTSMLNELNDLSFSVSSLADQVQNLRFDVDQEISAKVNEANAILANVHELNTQIAPAQATGGDVSGLRNQRDAAVGRLAEIIDIRIDVQPSGVMFVSTIDGVSLLNNNLHELQYAPAGPVNPGTIFNAITIHLIDPSTGLPQATGTPLEPHMNNGELRGLINMRSQELPDLAQQVGELAARTSDEINRIHNDGVSYPAPNSLTGRNTGLVAADAHGFTGQSTLAVVNSTGLLVTRIDVDFDANTYSVDGGAAVGFGGGTIGDVVTSLNTALGANGSMSFTNGVLSVNAANATDGIGFQQDATTPSSRGGRGFSHFFGLNDVLTANANSHFDTGLSATDAHGFTTGEQINFVLKGPNGEVAIDHTLTIAPGNIGSIITQLNAAGTGMGGFVTFAMDANGKISATPTGSFSDYRLEVADDSTNRGGTGVNFTSLFGLGEGFQMNQAKNLQIATHLDNQPQKLALAKLDLSGTPAPGDLVLSQSDNRAAAELQALQSQSVSILAAGGLQAASTTLGGFAGLILSDIGQSAARADALRDSNAELRNDIDTRIQNIEGVNVDEELANMIQYQQAYNAAARMISAADELFQSLLNAV